ncbi:MAG TPA: type III-B CRISPR module-associated protein Cmr5 [Anaerolineae bacterium]|nr:type III-B CRISPR module-associated protein Cmr5 [Anaerolineae bacterium]
MPSLQKTLDQERAKSAWENVSAVKARQSEEFEKKYSSLVRKAPMYILTNGLGQTLAFLKAKGKGEKNNEHEVFYQHLSRWVGAQIGIQNTSLLEWLLTQDSATYRRATTETLAYLNWLKRFAEASLKSEETD